MKKYYPILLSKQGELTALERLEHSVKERISPIIEAVPEIFVAGWEEKKKKSQEARDKDRNKKGLPPIDRSKQKEKPFENKLKTCLTTHWSFPNNQVLLDFAYCSSSDPKEMWALLNDLHDSGVNVIPVISGHSNAILIDLVSRFVIDNDKLLCIRLANQFGGFANNDTINSVVRMTNIPQRDIMLLFDNKYVVEDTYESALVATVTTLDNLSNFDVWNELIVSGGSFPKALLDPPYPPQKEPYLLKRCEWDLWTILDKNDRYNQRIQYSDYSIRHPLYEEVGFSGSASVKYTNSTRFVIYRGKKSGEDPLGNGQYIVHSKELVNSKHYPGEDFSWADSRIMEYSKRSPIPEPVEEGKKEKRPKSGAAKEWVAIGHNHHLTLINSLLAD